MKNLLLLAFIVSIISCSDIKENKQIINTEANNEADNKSANPTSKGDLSIQTSINGLPNQENIIDKNILKGKAFLLGGGIEENVCEITEACDCCNADLIFITDELFIYDDLCEGHYVRKGKYKLVGSEISLEFNPQLVSYFHNEESETNPTAPKNILKTEKKSPLKESFTISKCMGATIITNNNRSENIDLPVGILRERSTMGVKVGILKQIGVWALLEIK